MAKLFSLLLLAAATLVLGEPIGQGPPGNVDHHEPHNPPNGPPGGPHDPNGPHNPQGPPQQDQDAICKVVKWIEPLCIEINEFDKYGAELCLSIPLIGEGLKALHAEQPDVDEAYKVVIDACLELGNDQADFRRAENVCKALNEIASRKCHNDHWQGPPGQGPPHDKGPHNQGPPHDQGPPQNQGGPHKRTEVVNKFNARQFRNPNICKKVVKTIGPDVCQGAPRDFFGACAIFEVYSDEIKQVIPERAFFALQKACVDLAEFEPRLGHDLEGFCFLEKFFFEHEDHCFEGPHDPNGPNNGPNGPHNGPNGPHNGPNGPHNGPNGPNGPHGPHNIA